MTIQTAIKELHDAAAKVARLHMRDINQESIPDVCPIADGLSQLLVDTTEKGALSEVLPSLKDNQQDTADVFGLSRGTMRERMIKHGFLKPNKRGA